jgi:8-oxo-dGTP pyrophosphatase MutT (NUDIX family)
VAAGFRKGSEQTIYKGRIIEVAVGEFFTPDGERLERDLVHRPGAVCAVPIVGDEAILVRQYRPALDLELLEIPAGLRDVPDEPLEVTAERELAEEIGMHPRKLELLCAFYNTAGFCDEKIHVFLASDLMPVPQETQSAEEAHMTIERVRLDDVPALIASGELCDAKSIIGLTLAIQHQRQRQHRSDHASSTDT